MAAGIALGYLAPYHRNPWRGNIPAIAAVAITVGLATGLVTCLRPSR